MLRSPDSKVCHYLNDWGNCINSFLVIWHTEATLFSMGGSAVPTPVASKPHWSCVEEHPRELVFGQLKKEQACKVDLKMKSCSFRQLSTSFLFSGMPDLLGSHTFKSWPHSRSKNAETRWALPCSGDKSSSEGSCHFQDREIGPKVILMENNSFRILVMCVNKNGGTVSRFLCQLMWEIFWTKTHEIILATRYILGELIVLAN